MFGKSASQLLSNIENKKRSNIFGVEDSKKYDEGRDCKTNQNATCENKEKSHFTNSMKRLSINTQKCVACGLCIEMSSFIEETQEGKAKVSDTGIIPTHEIENLNNIIKVCPERIIYLENAGIVGSEGKEGLKELIEYIKKEFLSLNVNFPLASDYEFNKDEFIIPTAYGAGEYVYQYSSDDKAIRAGLEEFNRIMYSQRKSIIQNIIVEYKSKKLSKYAYYEKDDRNFYYSNNKKVENMLKTIIMQVNELSKNKIKLSKGFEKFEVVPRFGVSGDEINKEIYVYQIRHIEELYFIQDIMNELESLGWYDTYIDTDYIEDYRGKDVYCYRNINDVCNKFGQHLINEFPYVLNGSDGVKKILENVINKYVNDINDEIQKKAIFLIDQINSYIQNEKNKKNVAKENSNNKSVIKNHMVTFDGNKYFCVCPYCESNKIILEGIISKNLSKKMNFKNDISCDFCNGVISTIIKPIIIKQPNKVFFKCNNYKCDGIIEVSGNNLLHHKDAIIFDCTIKCKYCGKNINEVKKENITTGNGYDKFIEESKEQLVNKVNHSITCDRNINHNESDIVDDKNQYNEQEYNKYGFNKLNKSILGTDYNERGFNMRGIHKNGTRYDDEGFDINGIYKSGRKYDSNGFDVYGYNEQGYNKYGFNKLNKSRWGTDRNDRGFDINGIHKNGTRYDDRGFDIYGYDKNGKNKYGKSKDNLLNRLNK